MLKKMITLIIIMAVTLTFLQNCDTTEPPSITKIANTINLTVEWLDLKRIALKWNKSGKDKQSNFTYQLKRKNQKNNDFTKNFTLLGTDTTYIDDNEGDSLELGTNYIYKIEAYNTANELVDTSKTIITATLSPTSHNIVWEIDTLGQAGNFLSDVWGIDENNVWAVGYVNLPDGGSGIIKWDGIEWKTFSASSGVKYGIFGFSNNSIFVVGESENRGFAAIWDGTSWTEYKSNYFYEKGDTVYSLRAVWGSSPEDVWAVGLYGSIIHWDGEEWEKVQSPKPYHLYDLWGSNSDNIYSVVYSLSGDSRIFHYNGRKWTDISEKLPRESKGLISLWVDKSGKGYTVGGKTYSFNKNNEFEKFYINKISFLECVRGTSLNNVFISGQFGGVHHFNGIEWERYDELLSSENNELNGIQVFEKDVFIVGYTNKNVLILRGARK